VLEALARKITLDALDGRSSAQRLVLLLLESEGGGVAPSKEGRDDTAAERAEEAALEALGERYDEFNARFKVAVKAGSTEELEALAKEFHRPAEFPASGNFSGNLEKSRE
jgi:hypothetical protein